MTTTFGSIEELGIKGPEILRLLSLGIFDISEGTISYMAGEDPHFDGLDLPGVTLDIDTQRETAIEAYKPVLAKLMAEKFNTRLLSMSPVALQVFYCRGEIDGLASLEGKKVRTFNRAMADLVEAAGASTINLTFAEVVPAMQQGVADCAVTGTSAGNTARWWEVTDHLYPLPMGWSMTFFAANQDSWNAPRPQGPGLSGRGVRRARGSHVGAGRGRCSGRHQLQHRSGRMQGGHPCRAADDPRGPLRRRSRPGAGDSEKRRAGRLGRALRQRVRPGVERDGRPDRRCRGAGRLRPLLVHVVDSVITKVSRVMSRMGGVFLLLAALLVSVEILGRKILHLPFSVGTELSSYALAVGASWSFAQALLQRAHVRIDVLRNLLPSVGASSSTSSRWSRSQPLRSS